MAKRPIDRGPTAERVARSVRDLREARRLSLADLEKRLREIGRPILGSGISKIEQGDRRVDVDDLVALSLALDVTPNRLLMPPEADEERVELTPEVTGTARSVWKWACGDEPFRRDLWADKAHVFDLDRRRRFHVENRPHDELDDTPWQDVERHRDALDAVYEAVDAARGRGLSTVAVLGYVAFRDSSFDLLEAVFPAREARKGSADGGAR